MNDYQTLLKQVRGETGLSETSVIAWKMTANVILGQLNQDLSGIPLDDLATVHKLVQAKFNESNGLMDQHGVVVDENAPSGGSIIRLAETYIGKYPEAAFKVTVCYVVGSFNVYLARVTVGYIG